MVDERGRARRGLLSRLGRRKADAGAGGTPAVPAAAAEGPPAAAPVASPAKSSPAKTTAAKAPAKSTPAKTTPAKAAPARSTPGKATPAKTTPAKATPGKATPAKAAAKAAPAKSTPAKSTGSRSSSARGAARSEWVAEEFDAIRRELEAELRELRGQVEEAEATIDGLQRAASEGSGDDQADVGSAAFEREQAMSLANNSRELLEQTERALARLSNGTYGVCEVCGNPIGKARLMAFPKVTLCVMCKQRETRR